MMSIDTSSHQPLQSKKKVIPVTHTSVYDQTLTMMFSSQTLLSNQMDEIKDTSSVLTCYRCNRTIKAVDTLNDELHDASVKSRGGCGTTRQVDLFHMVNKMHKNRKMSDIDMTPAKNHTTEQTMEIDNVVPSAKPIATENPLEFIDVMV
jgi:hypothetical protein